MADHPPVGLPPLVAQSRREAFVDEALLAVEAPPHEPCRYAHRDSTAVDIAGYDAAGADHRAVADPHPLEHGDARSDPHVAPDVDRPVDPSIGTPEGDARL